jgi:hypothetical protein
MKHIIEQLAKKYNNKNIYDEKIVKKLKSYNGKASHYNSNYYELEDGTVIHEDFDEFYEEGRLTLHKFEGKEYSGEYVGYTNEDSILHFTDVENT